MKQALIRWLIIVLLNMGSGVIRLLPWKAALAVGGFLGRTAYCVLKKARETAWNNFTLALEDTFDDRQKNEILRKSFENLGKGLVEILKFGQINEKFIDQRVKFEGEENLKKAFAGEKGIVFVTGHVGNWELMGITLSIKGYPTNVIAAPLYDSRLDRIMNRFRELHGVQTITRGGEKGARKILSALKNNQILGLLIDQDIKADGVFVDFFNRKAFTPSGAASLALKSGAAVILGFIHRDSKDGHTISLQGPVPMIQSGNREQDIHDNTACFTKIIEENIRRYPDQWVWMHNRWKTPCGAQTDESP